MKYYQWLLNAIKIIIRTMKLKKMNLKWKKMSIGYHNLEIASRFKDKVCVSCPIIQQSSSLVDGDVRHLLYLVYYSLAHFKPYPV